MLPTTHSLQFRVHTRVLVTFVLVLLVLVVSSVGAPADRHRAEAATVKQPGNSETLVAEPDAARARRDDKGLAPLRLPVAMGVAPFLSSRSPRRG